MNYKTIFFAFIISTLLLLQQPAHGQKTTIACVGNGFTNTTALINHEKNNYPAQLQAILGKKYQVFNYGEEGSSVVKTGVNPYTNTKSYANALQSNPDIVIIEVAVNKTEFNTGSFIQVLQKDYKELIESFSKLSSHPRIILLTPLPFIAENNNNIVEPAINEQLIPAIQKLAYETNAEIINLYPLFIDNPVLSINQSHLSPLGATLIAKRMYEVLQLHNKKETNIFSAIKEDKKLYSFYGYECADFVFQQRDGKIVRPKKVAKGSPWVWRARFWAHEPQADIALLERGFHIVYCDVQELFGNKEAISLWNKFYAYMQQAGLSKKVALEGMSRGGVYIYNWALANPEKVACIYADAPVLDIKSWPGGKYKGPGSKADWEVFKKDYQLTEQQALQFHNSPLDNAEKIAKLGFPMLHVVGDADEVVPVEENTGPFEKRIMAAGGTITVIHKPGVKHHPHSLANPTPIVDFIVKATGQKTNFAILSMPGSEYRSAAGWQEGKDWWAQDSDINQLLLSKKNIDIIFLGNSITQGIGGNRSAVTYKPGKLVFDSVFAGYNYIAAGISGDRTQHILWRLQNGNYAAAKPKFIVLTIGVNNYADDSGTEVAEGIGKIIQWLRTNMTSTKIILTGPLPCGLKKTDSNRLKYEQTHRIIQKMGDNKYIYYYPMAKYFIKENGDLNLQYFSEDGIHLIPGGYQKWAELLYKKMKAI